jgi:hypothetical protein
MDQLKKTLSAKPPIANQSKNNNDIEKKEQEMNFINEGWVTVPSPANLQAATPSAIDDAATAWAIDNARDDVFKIFNVRLSEPLFLKLKHIAQLQKRSTNSICIALIQDFVDKEWRKK